jgi:hypothetical protein
MSRHHHVHTTVLAYIVLLACPVAAAPQERADLETLLTRVAERVAAYYQRAQRVMCVERSTVQPLQSNWTPDGFARTVESDLRVESEPSDGDVLPKAHVIRDIRRINGRAPRERDRTDRSACTDPNPLSPEPLDFLLPSQRQHYRFTAARAAREEGRAVVVIDFSSVNRKSQSVLVEDERGHDDCFDWTGPLATRGRVWVDAETYDVLRVERGNDGPLDVRVPWELQRRYQLPPSIVIERDDLVIRYRPAAFRDPDEVMLLPHSIDALTVVRTALQSTRRTETYSEYQRFLTAGRIVKDQ